MLVAEHGRVSHSLAGWQIAVVVLRYFVAVLMLCRWLRTSREGIATIVVFGGPSCSNRRPKECDAPQFERDRRAD
jgi:hypothetical protein